SPGDSRQDHELSQLPRPKAGDPNDPERPLARSLDFERLGVKAYERWFKRMHDHHLDWARVWMCPWWCGLEWTRAWDGFGALTVYSQASAARMDRIMDLAKQSRIYIQIELNNHGMAGEPGLPDSEWNDSPYNVRNGGPCRRAWEYQASDEAFALQAKR